jgi:hypothetical protein
MWTKFIELLRKIIEYGEEIIPLQEPWNRVIVLLILSICVSLFVILIGFIIERITTLMFQGLCNGVGQGFAHFICYKLTFVGTIIHEMSHALFAFITGAKVNKIKCFTFDKETLGYVEYTARGNGLHRMVQHALTACAPVLMGFSVMPLFIGLAFGVSNIGLKILFWYCAVSVFIHMDMSVPDIKNYFRGYPIVLMILFAIMYLMDVLFLRVM